MIKAFLLVVATCGAALGATTEHSARGHRVLLSGSEKNHRKWMIFPEQKDLHKTQQNSFLRPDMREDLVVRLDDAFWDNHKDLLKLNEEGAMQLQRSFNGVGADVTHHRFDQTIHGMRVFGGDFIVTVGAHGGVLRLNGLPITQQVDASTLQRGHLSEDRAIEAIEKYVSKRMDDKTFPFRGSSKVELAAPMELGWHNSLFAVAKEGTITLAYFVNGMVGSKSAQALTFDAFVCAHTGKVLQFMDKSMKGETSPFSSPIPNATIKVYDQWRKDLNDDLADDYYSPDPDKYSNLTLVFDTETGLGYPYPTTDYEMNELIDNTLYVKYMYYSLSGGEYLTWNLTETDLNIEYNLSIANAFFDGIWGIHFGTGYITDDVVPHEWSHGYTQTGNGLIYAYESGAMNEAFSDIYGESVDILNHDTTDPDVHRAIWPTECHMTLNSPGVAPGSDYGTRWSMGENVTTPYPNGDGSLRDMYKPECFYQPSTTDADYYSCTTYADSGGVHKNSGVLNRLYAVLTDGGEYTNPSEPSEQLEIYGLGFTKATNLFWRVHQVLTPTSQFMDFATAINEVCEDNIGAAMNFPNLFNYTLIPSNETLTEEDCTNVANAVTGSGMDSDADFCPNIACDADDIYDCRWVNCSASDTTLYYEDYDYYMGLNGEGSLTAICADEGNSSSYARVFEQTDDDMLSVSCIQFGYFMNGQTSVVLSLYIDVDGGDPDESMELLGSMSVTTINAVGQFQVQTASFDEAVDVVFPNDAATLVVVLTTPSMSSGYIIGGGSPNADVVETIGDTYVGGGCVTGYQAYYDYARMRNMTTQEDNQWYVKLHASESGTSEGDDAGSNGSSSNDDDGLSDGEVAGVAIGAIAGAAILGVAGYFVYTTFVVGGTASKAPLLTNQL